MNIYGDPRDIPTVDLENKQLEKLIGILRSNPTKNNMNRFIEHLLPRSLIVLVDDLIHESANSFDEDGFFTLDKNNNIPLVTFEEENGNIVFPVFTNVSYAENLPYFEGYIPLIVPAFQVLEMAHSIICDKLTFNFESNEMIELGETLIDSLVFKLVANGNLYHQSSFGC